MERSCAACAGSTAWSGLSHLYFASRIFFFAFIFSLFLALCVRVSMSFGVYLLHSNASTRARSVDMEKNKEREKHIKWSEQKPRVRFNHLFDHKIILFLLHRSFRSDNFFCCYDSAHWPHTQTHTHLTNRFVLLHLIGSKKINNKMTMRQPVLALTDGFVGFEPMSIKKMKKMSSSDYWLSPAALHYCSTKSNMGTKLANSVPKMISHCILHHRCGRRA